MQGWEVQSPQVSDTQQTRTKMQIRSTECLLVTFTFTNVQGKQDISFLLIIFSTTCTLEVLCFQLYLYVITEQTRNGSSDRLQLWEEGRPGWELAAVLLL